MADDLFKKFGDKFSKLGKEIRTQAGPTLSKVGAGIGEGVRTGASAIKKTAGIGVGTIGIDLAKHTFSPGDTITGTVRLSLTEDTDAKRLVVALLGTRDKLDYGKDASGRRVQQRHTETVFEHERELDGARSYRAGEYSFELTVPDDAATANRIETGGLAGDVARVVSSVANAGRMPTTWRVVAFLDIPWKRNVKHKVDIVVRG
jgi:hypothetical protein